MGPGQLLQFRVRNYRSLLAEQVFSFREGVAGGHNVAVLFGPNGAGKTNFIRALGTLRDLVVHSAALQEAQYAEHYTPFGFPSPQDPAIDLSIELQLPDGRYRYSMSYDADRIVFEKLLVYRTGKPQRWFERHYDRRTGTDQWATFSPYFTGTRELWRRMTRPKSLFLTTAACLGCDQLRPFMAWFESGLDIRLHEKDEQWSQVKGSLRAPGAARRLVQLLQALDMPIRDIRLRDADRPSCLETPQPREEIVEFLHELGDAESHWVDLKDEASGTVRLLILLVPLLRALEDGGMVVMDEFDTGLHPLLGQSLIKLVKSPCAASPCSQFLLTSHDAVLMEPQFLDRDEIWLMERTPNRSSHLLPMAERRPRKRERLLRTYLSGRYGAIPKLGSEISLR